MILAFSFVSFLKGLLLFFIVASALLLMLVVLLQEPKGGGLSSAFGGAGAESFGVQTGGVNKFTAWVAGIFMFLSVIYAAIRDEGADIAPSDVERGGTITAPADGCGDDGSGCGDDSDDE